MKGAIPIFLALLMALLTQSCSNSLRLPPGETLFRGSKIRIDDKNVSAKERKILRADLAGLVRPKPNSQFLGIRLKLTLYNAAGNTNRKKGLRHWLRYKVGEPPVLTSSINFDANKKLMANYLHNRGYFYNAVDETTDTTKRKKATAVFDVTTGIQYTINKVYFVHDTSTLIAKHIDSTFDATLLKNGNPYSLTVVKAERERIDRMLKEKGYFYFKPDYVYVVADSSIGNHQVNMYVKLKHREIPEEAYKVYAINDIYIYADYKLSGKKEDTSKANKTVVDSYYVIDSKNAFKPSLLADAMIFEKGDLYSLDDQNRSLSRLVNMGVFKFVKNRFEPFTDSLMDVYYYLTPFPKKSIRFEIGGLTQNDNRVGTEGSISWRNRNAFKGAEELLFKINAGIEVQYSGVGSLPDIYNFGAESDLSFPRFVVPFVDLQTDNRFLPRSVIKLKYSYESESNLIRITSYTASYGYDWKVGLNKEFQLYPFNLTYVQTDTLGNADALALLYGNLIFRGIIIGPTFEYTYNSAAGIRKKDAFYFDGLIDLSGNILGIAEGADYASRPQTLLGTTYAQYVKLQPDFRYYHSFSDTRAIASRIVAGVGIPYGNSASLPNIKEFWAGGNSDLRGFPSRLVGPGTFNEGYIYGTNQFIETLGDLKLEINAEYRQNVYKFINLGLFAEAGNIWLYRKNPSFPGGEFTPDFYRQLAADVGFGFRFDFKILILRLDLGMPVREPWLQQNDRWVFNNIDFASSSWRKNNLVYNIAIGYPF